MAITITNFGQVSPTIWRGAQPTVEQFAELAALGVKTVIDLREEIDRDEERQACLANGLVHVDVPILGILPPTERQVKATMLLLTSGTPTFVHCAHGEDRTGAMIAAYRMLVDGWTNSAAYAEAKAYHIAWEQVLIREWIEHFDPKDYR